LRFSVSIEWRGRGSRICVWFVFSWAVEGGGVAVIIVERVVLIERSEGFPLAIGSNLGTVR
jgi:hypothetical protein